MSNRQEIIDWKGRAYGVVIHSGCGLRLQIREFQLGDYEEAVKVWKDSGIMLRPGDDLEGIKLKLQRDPDLFLVVENDRQIIGVVLGAWDGRRGWTNHLAVRSGHRRSGIGKALVRELERRLARKGALKVNAQIYKTNEQSLAFFKALDYELHSDLIMIGRDLKR